MSIAATDTGVSQSYTELRAYLRESAVLGSVSSLVGWDQETYQPAKGASLKADQRKLLSRLLHERATSSELGDLIEKCEQDETLQADPVAAANLRELRRDYDRSTRMPSDLVQDMAECASTAMQVWRQARTDSDFASFLPQLRRVVELNRKKAECLRQSPEQSAYDILLDGFEPGMTSAHVSELFAELRDATVEMVDTVRGSSRSPDRSMETAASDLDAQRRLCQEVMSHAGFDFSAGRFDDTTHPFCSGFGPGDTRMTNRYREDGWTDALTCALHEGGHGLYEQGLPKVRDFGLPSAASVSLGLHESQSRLWENQVGRSEQFAQWVTPLVREMLGGTLAGATPEQVCGALNVIEPSLIRVEADEVTYNLHIMLRYDLERGMIEGEIDPADVPAIWNERMKSDMGVDVPDDRRGCLQDVHWSMCAMGYFPTYTLGNMFSAMWWHEIGKAVPDREERIAKGDFAPILNWTREHIHAHGRRYRAHELAEKLTGGPLTPKPLIEYLRGKVARYYG